MAQYKREVQNFLKFFSVKRDIYTSEVEAIFRDFRDERLSDDVFSKEEVERLLDDLLGLTKARVSRDLGTTADMAALVLEQVMSGAADAGVALAVDMSRTEDSAALERVRALSAAAFTAGPDGGAGGVSSRGGGAGGRLDSIRDEHGKLVAERQRLADEVQAGRTREEAAAARVGRLEGQLAAAEDRAARAEEAAAAAAAAAASARAAGGGGGGGGASAPALAAALARADDLAAALEGARAEAAAARAERDGRMADSRQFAQLRALMAKKNAQIGRLRASLGKYEEPDKGDGDGDGDGEDGGV